MGTSGNEWGRGRNVWVGAAHQPQPCTSSNNSQPLPRRLATRVIAPRSLPPGPVSRVQRCAARPVLCLVVSYGCAALCLVSHTCHSQRTPSFGAYSVGLHIPIMLYLNYRKAAETKEARRVYNHPRTVTKHDKDVIDMTTLAPTTPRTPRYGGRT